MKTINVLNISEDEITKRVLDLIEIIPPYHAVSLSKLSPSIINTILNNLNNKKNTDVMEHSNDSFMQHRYSFRFKDKLCECWVCLYEGNLTIHTK